MMRITATIAAAAMAAALVASACSGSNSSSNTTPPIGNTGESTTTGQRATTARTPSTTLPATTTVPATTAVPTPATTVPIPTTTLPGAVDPNAPEVVAPGDIPDNQVFVAFASSDGVYTVKVPEGWARTETGGVVTFTDKYNSIAVQSSPAAAAPTVESMTTNGLSDVTSDPTFTLIDVKPVTRKAGTGVLATYEIGSALEPGDRQEGAARGRTLRVLPQRDHRHDDPVRRQGRRQRRPVEDRQRLAGVEVKPST